MNQHRYHAWLPGIAPIEVGANNREHARDVAAAAYGWRPDEICISYVLTVIDPPVMLTGDLAEVKRAVMPIGGE